MKLKIKRNLNHVAKKKNKNQPHASHTSHVTINNKKIRAMQPCKNTSHATMQTMWKRLKVT